MAEEIYVGALAEIKEELGRLEALEKYFIGLLKISFIDEGQDRVIEISRSTVADVHTQLDCAIDGIHYHLNPKFKKTAVPAGGAA